MPKVEITVRCAYLEPKRPCCKGKKPSPPSVPKPALPGAPDIVPDVNMPDVNLPSVSIPKPDMPNIPKPNLPNVPKPPGCPCKKPKGPTPKYTINISTGGVLGVGATDYTSDEFEDSGNYLSNFRSFEKEFDIDEDEKKKGGKKFTITFYKKTNPLLPAKTVCACEYEPDLSDYWNSEQVKLSKGGHGKGSYIYVTHYLRR